MVGLVLLVDRTRLGLATRAVVDKPLLAQSRGINTAWVGASLLSQIGLSDLIADSVEAYVETAVTLASDPAQLEELRRSLRPRMATSPLCDAGAFARKIEAAYRTMWRRWCAAQDPDESGADP